MPKSPPSAAIAVRRGARADHRWGAAVPGDVGPESDNGPYVASNIALIQSVFRSAVRRHGIGMWRGVGSPAPVTEKRIGRSRCPEARLWGLNGVGSRGPRGDGSRSMIDARPHLVTTGARGAPRRPGRERRAVHGRCHQPRGTRGPELGPVECRRDAATVGAGDHHEVSGFTNRAGAAGTSRSMRVISP
jgi:hypothetical protein